MVSAKGREIPATLLGQLRDSTASLKAPSELREAMERDGYLLLRRVLPVEDVIAARRAVFDRLAAVDEIAEPSLAGITTGRSRRLEREPDTGAFWKSVSEEQALRRVTHGPAITDAIATLFGTPVVGHDLVYLRAAAVGRSLDLHYDFPFFCRLHDSLVTSWIPLGDAPLSDGPIYVVEGSHRFDDLLAGIGAQDAIADRGRKYAFDSHPVDLAAARSSHVLVTDFHAGDVLVFGMRTAHGSLDNCSPIGRARLSCDLRWQPAHLPRDEAYFGPDPRGVTGTGYAGLNGAKPLTASWITN